VEASRRRRRAGLRRARRLDAKSTTRSYQLWASQHHGLLAALGCGALAAAALAVAHTVRAMNQPEVRSTRAVRPASRGSEAQFLPHLTEYQMSLFRTAAPAGGTANTVEHLVDRMVRNVSHGRFERSLSGLTALSVLVTGA
jgi:hypothetical protein